MKLLKRHTCNTQNPEYQGGYTLVEMLFVCGIVVAIALMGMGAYSSQRKFGIQKVCVARLKQIAQFQESFKDIGDPSLNPDSSYGTFFELQNAGYIPSSFVSTDTEAHDVQAYVPYYQIEIVKSEHDLTEEPDRNHYLVLASPVGSDYSLRIFMMGEDGEVYFYSDNTQGIRMVWE